jgi:hypothetical protein
VDRDEVAALEFCYVTTKGRRSGSPHTIEIWFALREDTVYVLSGGGTAATGSRTCAMTRRSAFGSATTT